MSQMEIHLNFRTSNLVKYFKQYIIIKVFPPPTISIEGYPAEVTPSVIFAFISDFFSNYFITYTCTFSLANFITQYLLKYYFTIYNRYSQSNTAPLSISYFIKYGYVLVFLKLHYSLLSKSY